MYLIGILKPAKYHCEEVCGNNVKLVPYSTAAFVGAEIPSPPMVDVSENKVWIYVHSTCLLVPENRCL